MANSVPIEIGLLCDILERLCRSLVLASSSSRDLKLHNVTLPRSWLMKPICVEEERRKHFSQLPNLIIPIGDLLAQVYTGRFAGADNIIVSAARSPEIPLCRASHV